MHIANIERKVFRSAGGEEYGPIRKLDATIPSELMGSAYIPFACDDCGNYFVQKLGVVAFWDHETNEISALAQSDEEFVNALVDPEPVVLKPGQVKSVQIDPEFAKKFGLNTKNK